MGWKGTVRSISAAMRAAEREAQRQRKAAQRQQIADDAAAAVAEWEDHIEEITSVHTDLTEVVDWQAISKQPKPPKPELNAKHTQRAKATLAEFKPSFLDKFRGGAEKREARLKREIVEAQAQDERNYRDAINSYKTALLEWETDTALARRLLSGDVSATIDVIKEMQSLSDQHLIGSSVSFSTTDGHLHAKPVVHTDEIIPNFRRKQLASGKLSETQMPAGQFHQLYQDYVASVALKVAGDLFCILPIDELFVTCLSEMLNSQTGHKEIMPILSVKIVRNTFKSLNLAELDPSDSMKNFSHAMSFKKTSGFSPVDPLLELD